MDPRTPRRVVRIEHGREILRGLAAARDTGSAQVVGTRLVHGDVVEVAGDFYHVCTIRGCALECGEDPDAALAENDRRRAARTLADYGGPAWCEEQWLSGASVFIANDGLTGRERHERACAAANIGGRVIRLAVGERVLLNGRMFRLGADGALVEGV